MTETARTTHGEMAALGDADWSGPQQAADRYLAAVGVSLPDVREELVEAAAERLELENRSLAPRIRKVRILACVERVLCERLGARPGSGTSDPDTARRRLLFAVDPTVEAQQALLRTGPRAFSGTAGDNESLTRIPEIHSRRRMPRQHIAFRRLPFRGLRYRKDASR